MKVNPTTDWNHFQLQPLNERMLLSSYYIAREAWYNDCPQPPLGHLHAEHDYQASKSHPLSWLVWECYDRLWDYIPYYNLLLAPVARKVKYENARDRRLQILRSLNQFCPDQKE
jgi:hypothetical protein